MFEFTKAKNSPVSDEEMISDLQKVAGEIGTEKITQKIYREHGKYDESNICRRFGTWNKALLVAGLSISNQQYSDEQLFENILVLWQHYGRQPKRAELANTPSTISQGPYNRRFGSWNAALEQFVDFANATELNAPLPKEEYLNQRKTGRDPSLRLRFKVLSRDNFVCKQCGASPAKNPEVELHVDHVFPWSKGGETTIENLQTLCSSCNLGKSNLTE
ncbi:MAG: HNH endonuclease [Gammaproteobacteria bacterium]|nr:HNH endonuclease [Gammaproteobacteria bacterium]MBU1448040.1 HNH endonuclease [Gammaproteobacteria bacterium]